MRLFLPLALFSAVIPSLQAGVIGSDGIAAAHASSLKAATATVCVPGDDGEEETCRQASNPEQEEEAVSEASYQASYPATAAADGDDPLGSDIGLPQQLDAGHSRGILDVVAEARRYMTDVVAAEDRYSRVRDLCRNEHESCAFWALLGECDKNPGYMKVNCAPVCQSCEMKHVETRCPLDPNARDAFAAPGDLNRMFETIVTDPYYQQFKPVVLSRPDYAPGDTAANATYKVGSIWMVMFDNAVTEEEADRLVELGGVEGYARSSDVGAERADGTHDVNINSGRTSTNAWCNGECYGDPVAVGVVGRIENITGVPETNSEYLQLLRYEEGQFYQVHNDYIPYQLERPSGVRTLTFYIYLNDVEEGGETNFPKLDLSVTPKKGRAVMWPSVLDSDPNKKDFRSDHQAMPVKRGIKYGANAWIHQRDFKTANRLGCS